MVLNISNKFQIGKVQKKHKRMIILNKILLYKMDIRDIADESQKMSGIIKLIGNNL